MNPRIFWSSFDFAQTIKISAIGEFVIQVFDPCKTYPPFTFCAYVSKLAGSEPWLGSVNPKAPTNSPVAIKELKNND